MVVRFTPEARTGVREKRAWWEAHRDKAPGLFREELKDAVAMLRLAPTDGAQRYTVHGEEVIWRRLMPKTRHHLYFRVVATDQVEVLTLWNAQGRGGPDLGAL